MNQCLFTAPLTYVLVWWFLLNPLAVAVGFLIGHQAAKKDLARTTKQEGA